MTSRTIIATIAVATLIGWAYINQDSSVKATQEQAQPQSRTYQAPEWVIQNGRQCIRQGTVITCG